MNVGKTQKRIFSVSILLLMTVLAAFTIVAFAGDGKGRAIGSYSLMVEKKFADGTPQEVREQTYSFKIQGKTVKGDDIKDISITYAEIDASGEIGEEKTIEEGQEKIVTIAGEGSIVVAFEDAFNVSVVELTDPGGFEDANGTKWSLASSSRESSMYVSGRTQEIVISRGNGFITIQRAEEDQTRPSTCQTTYFRVIGKNFSNHSEDSDKEENEIVYTSDIVAVEPGGECTFTNLPMGEYVVEEMKASEGFSVTVGEREIKVDGGYAEETAEETIPNKAVVHINTASGSLTIYAPKLTDGRKMTHYYNVEGPSNFRDIPILSGETYTLDNLPAGNYTIYVSKTYSGKSGYQVKAPVTNTKKVSKTLTLSGNAYTSTRSWYTKDAFETDADYITNLNFGPLFNSSGISLKTEPYSFAVGTNKDASTVTRIATFEDRSGARTTNFRINPTNNTIRFSVYGVKNEAAKYFNVSWYENKQDIITADNATSFEVDDRGWVEIFKPEDPDDTGISGEFVNYYYTIRDAENTPITDYKIYNVYKDEITGEETEEEWDNADYEEAKKENATARLMANQRIKITGLEAGSYKIEQTTERVHPMEFYVTVAKETKKVMDAEASFEIITLGERTVTFAKPAGEDGGRDYIFEIIQLDQDNNEIEDSRRTVTLKAGQSLMLKNIYEVENLPAGHYRIRAMNDQDIGYQLLYSDGCTVKVDSSSHAKVTFTNTFTPELGSYRFIHEYYIKDGNTYQLEGVSAVETRNEIAGRKEYYANEITIEPEFNGQHYIHCGDAYGLAAILSCDIPEDPVVHLGEGQTAENGPYQSSGRGVGPHRLWKYSYVPVNEMNCVQATDDQNGTTQIIILRYYREVEPPVNGKYKVVHLYYYRGQDGDEFEGRTEISEIDTGMLTKENQGTKYTVENVEKKTSFTIPESQQTYQYTYDSVVYGIATGGAEHCYIPDTTKDFVYATEEGNQIIVLRYYRNHAGSYNVVHEYYYRTKTDGNEVSDGEGGEEEEDIHDGSSNIDAHNMKEEDGGTVPDIGDSETESSFAGTLNNDEEYSYAFVGALGIESRTAKLESIHYGEAEEQKPDYNSEKFTYHSVVYGEVGQAKDYGVIAYKQWATATEDGNQIIILRYYLDSNPTPEDPTEPKPTNPTDPTDPEPEDPTEPKPTNPTDPTDPEPEDPTEPETTDPTNPEPTDPTEPETTDPTDPTEETDPTEPEETNPTKPSEETKPTNPTDPTEEASAPSVPAEEPTPTPAQLPDPNDPDSPDTITIWDNGTPRDYIKVWNPEEEVWIYLPEDEVPLSWLNVTNPTDTEPDEDAPKTGDDSKAVLWGALALISVCGIGMLLLGHRKKKEQN